MTDTNQPDHIVDMHEMVVDTNQASELDTILTQHREWVRGIRTDRLIGTSHAETKAAIQSLIRTEKLKLLAEVREQTTIFKIKAHDEKGQPHLYEAGRGVPTEVVDKLEAEL